MLAEAGQIREKRVLIESRVSEKLSGVLDCAG
jgi:hypothetical protein